MARTKKTPTKLTAQVCLYGAPHCGYAFLATVEGREGQLAGGWRKSALEETPGGYDCLTSCIWSALYDVRETGATGLAIVHAPGGDQFAVFSIESPSSAGDARWLASTQANVDAALSLRSNA